MKAGDFIDKFSSWERAQVRTRGKDPSRHKAVRVYRVGGGSSAPDGRPHQPAANFLHPSFSVSRRGACQGRGPRKSFNLVSMSHER